MALNSLWSIVTNAIPKSDVTNCISFSGIDGAGKSTQIQALCTALKEDGRQVLLIRFWDDVAKLTQFRETAGHTIFKGDKGVGTPCAPINRRDKNVRSFLMTGVRLFIYFFDAISVRNEVRQAMRSNADVVIFDRYIYDELANLSLSNPAIRAYVWLIMKLVPKPNISFLLDADPVEARARKPENTLNVAPPASQRDVECGARCKQSDENRAGQIQIICDRSLKHQQDKCNEDAHSPCAAMKESIGPSPLLRRVLSCHDLG